MRGPVSQIQNKTRSGYQELLRIKGALAVRLATGMGSAKSQLSNGLATQHPAKIVAGLALGSVLVILIGLPLGLTGAGNSAVSLPNQTQEVAPSIADPYDRSLHDDVPGEEQLLTPILLKADKVQRCQVILGEEWFHPISGELIAPLPEWIHFDSQTNTYVKQDC